MPPGRSTLILFSLASLLTVACGALAMANSGLGAALWLRNLVAWIAGAGLALAIRRFPPSNKLIIPLAIGLLALTFLMPGQAGVHRWFSLGPLQINAAALILPITLVSLRPERFSWLLFLAGALLLFQPDASQLTALAIGAALYVIMVPAGQLTRLIVVGSGLVAIVQVWLSPIGFLPPVAHVEGIVGLGWAQSPLLAIGMVGALAVTALSPWLLWSNPDKRAAAVALSGYFSASALSAAFGAFPVPLAGYGVSFVLGWWLAIGYLAEGHLPGKPLESPLS